MEGIRETVIRRIAIPAMWSVADTTIRVHYKDSPQ
jgi:hypothetical protein